VKRQPPPVLITDAERSPDDQLRSRQIRYVGMLWLWVPLCVVGMVLLPWLAVIIANDRPPKERYRLSRRLHRAQPVERGPRVLPTQPGQPAGDQAEDRARPRTIDVEP
jgi:hypothetical protein